MVKSLTSSCSGRSKSSSSSEDMYRGVRKRKWGKWVSEIRLPNSRARIWLGSYDTPEKAARAFDAALFCLRGTSANFNFPHTLPQIPGGRSLLPSQIQAAAARYANNPSEDNSSSSCNSSELEFSNSPFISVQTDQYQYQYQDQNQDQELMSYMNNMLDTNDFMSHLPGFETYQGFDDYFMTTPPVIDYQENDVDTTSCDDASFLWNF